VSNAIGFENTIKPYFTPCYRAHMLIYGPKIDLWDGTVVQSEWGSIFNAVTGRDMPAAGCPEGIWDDATRTQFLSDFQAWKVAGFPNGGAAV
jgi:hypothetical protein